MKNDYGKRIVAIDSLLSMVGFEIETSLTPKERIDELSKEQLKELLLLAYKTINRAHYIAHGTHCCQGRGDKELEETLNNEGRAFYGDKFIDKLNKQQ